MLNLNPRMKVLPKRSKYIVFYHVLQRSDKLLHCDKVSRAQLKCFQRVTDVGARDVSDDGIRLRRPNQRHEGIWVALAAIPVAKL